VRLLDSRQEEVNLQLWLLEIKSPFLRQTLILVFIALAKVTADFESKDVYMFTSESDALALPEPKSMFTLSFHAFDQHIAQGLWEMALGSGNLLAWS